jgi:hypothetical protein
LNSVSGVVLASSASVADCVGAILLSLSIAGCHSFSTDSDSVHAATEAVKSAGQNGAVVHNLPPETAQEAAEREAHPMPFLPERMSIRAPQGDVPMGNPVQLVLTMAPGKIADLEVLQSNEKGTLRQSHFPANIVKQDGANLTIEVIPVQLGPVNVEVGAIYADNAVVRQTASINVVPSAKGLTKFSLNQGFTAIELRLDGIPRHALEYL